jgi:phage-related protein (TIGR01555 family)
MDLFKAQDAATKALLKNAVANVIRAGTTDGFDNFLSRVGLNNDNALSASTYEFNLVTRNRVLLEAAYRGSWIVGRVVDSIAEDMTRAGLDITTSKGAEQIKSFQKAVVRLQIWNSLRLLIKWGRLYGGALGILQIRGQDPATPLNLDSVGRGQFQGIVVFDRWTLNPLLTPVIQSGPDMGLPAYYQIINTPQSTDPTVKSATGIIRVHHSRVIRYTGIDLPWYQAITEMMWGESVLERLWDRLIAFDNATMSSASLIDRANLRHVGIENLREILAAGGEAQAGLEKMFEMMRMMQVNEGLTLTDKNDEVGSTAYSFAGLSDMLIQFGQQLAGASETPLVRLFGQSPAGLSATGEADMRMYYDSINAQQEAKLRNPFEVVLKVMWRSEFGMPTPDDLEFSFTPLWQMSALDKATIAKTTTETVLGAHEAGLVPTPTAMRELRNSSGNTGTFSDISDEDIAEAELEPPPLPEDPTVDPEAEPVRTLDRKWWKRWLGVTR